VIKVHFVTDSGFETWRISKNVAVYVAKNVTAYNGEEWFFDSRLE